MSELKPCPFCGKSAAYDMHTFGDSMIPYFRVICEQGHCLDEWLETAKEAAESWNRRAPDPEKVALVARVKELGHTRLAQGRLMDDLRARVAELEDALRLVVHGNDIVAIRGESSKNWRGSYVEQQARAALCPTEEAEE